MLLIKSEMMKFPIKMLLKQLVNQYLINMLMLLLWKLSKMLIDSQILVKLLMLKKELNMLLKMLNNNNTKLKLHYIHQTNKTKPLKKLLIMPKMEMLLNVEILYLLQKRKYMLNKQSSLLMKIVPMNSMLLEI